MRIYKNITFDKDRETIRLMQLLTEPDVSVEDYRHAFYRLGRELGLLLNEKAAAAPKAAPSPSASPKAATPGAPASPPPSSPSPPTAPPSSPERPAREPRA